MSKGKSKQNKFPPVMAYIHRWQRARTVLNAGNVIPLNHERGIYSVRLDAAKEAVEVNLVKGICSCKKQKVFGGRARAVKIYCPHMDAAFLYLEEAINAVELVEDLVNQLNG